MVTPTWPMPSSSAEFAAMWDDVPLGNPGWLAGDGCWSVIHPTGQAGLFTFGDTPIEEGHRTFTGVVGVAQGDSLDSYIVLTAAQAATIPAGSKVMIYTSTGALRSSSEYTVGVHPPAVYGYVNVPLDPPIGTFTGDQARVFTGGVDRAFPNSSAVLWDASGLRLVSGTGEWVPNDGDTTWYWPGPMVTTGSGIGTQLWVFASKQDVGSPWTNVGRTLWRYDWPSAGSAPTNPTKIAEWGTGVNWGSGVIEFEDHIYIYGVVDTWLGVHKVYVARCPAGSIPDPAEWEFLRADMEWVVDPDYVDDATGLYEVIDGTPGVENNLSAHVVAGTVTLCSKVNGVFGEDVGLWEGSHPAGPFTPRTVASAPYGEPTADDQTYLANYHPEFGQIAGDGGYLLSVSRNRAGVSLGDFFDAADWYRPMWFAIEPADGDDSGPGAGVPVPPPGRTRYALEGLIVEIALDPSGGWTDVTSRLVLDDGVTIQRPRRALGDEAPATTLDLTLSNVPDDNGVMPFTPGNALSPYYPYVVPDRLIRVTAVYPTHPQTGATATAYAGSGPAYLIASDADAADVGIGDQVQIFDSAGRLKERTVFKVASKPSGFGFTNLVLDQPCAAAFAAGDQLRVVTESTASSVRFLGWIDSWAPETPDGEPNRARVKVSASDVLSRYARRRLLSDYIEQGNFMATLWGYKTLSWPFDDGDAPRRLRVVSSDPDLDVEAAEVVRSKVNSTGSADFSAPEGGLRTDGQVHFRRADDGEATCPIILAKLPTGYLCKRVSFWARLESAPVGFDDALVGYDLRGRALWRFGPIDIGGEAEWAIRDAAGNSNVMWTALGDTNDGAWRWWSLFFYLDGGTPMVGLAVRDRYRNDVILGLAAMPARDGQDTRYISVGGYMPPLSRGKNLNSFMGWASGLQVSLRESGTSISDVGPAPSSIASPDYVVDAATRAAQLAGYVTGPDWVLGGSSIVGDADTDTLISPTSTAGRTVLDVWSELADTTGARLVTRPDGKRAWIYPSAARPTTVSLTLDVAGDLDDKGPVWEVPDRYTRALVSSPEGSVEVVNRALEAVTLVPTDTRIDTCAGNLSVARQPGAVLVYGGEDLRAAAFVVDPTTSEADVWADLYGLVPGDRVRITGLPAGHLGRTYADVYAAGWTEDYDASGRVLFTFDAEPADGALVEAYTDDAEYGRVSTGGATATGGTCIGTTSTGTLIVTTSGPAWTTTSGDYPLDLDWNGERITVSGVSGSSSPQSFTVSARGVPPTVARAHSSGEVIDVWHGAKAGW